MPGIRRNKAQRLAQREQIAAFRLSGWTRPAIARELGISDSTVQRELKILDTEWRESASEDIAAIKARELHKLDRMEAEASHAWERSKRNHRKVVLEAGGGVRRETSGQTGDPRYLATILSIQDRRARMLGLDMPTKFAPTTPTGEGLDLRAHDGAGWDLAALSYEELITLRALQSKAKAKPPAPEPEQPASGAAS